MKICMTDWFHTIAQKYGISGTLSKEIISSYIEYNIQKVISGERVVIPGIVSVLPKYQTASYFTTPAYDCSVIARNKHLSEVAVNGIVFSFIETVRQSLLDGDTVSLRGLCTLSIVTKDDVTTIYVDISRALVGKLKEIDSSARAKVDVKLRREIARKFNTTEESQEKAVDEALLSRLTAGAMA